MFGVKTDFSIEGKHMKLNDLTGRRFGRWTAIETAKGAEARSYVRWFCVCDCGNTKYVARGSLLNGESQSCGCLRREVKTKATTHRLSRTVEYSVWKNMMSRCNNPKNKAYSNYGERGVQVCERWHSFEAFLADMGKRPDGMTLERDDNNGNYSKENCRWASRQVQQSNTRRTVRITVNGVSRTQSEWAAISGVGRNTIAYRLKKGVPAELAVTVVPKLGRKLPKSSKQ